MWWLAVDPLPLDPIQAVIGLGVSGVLAVGIWALGTGKVRVGALVDKAMAEIIALLEKRIAEVAKERDDWKSLALGQASELKRLNDLLGTAVDLLLGRGRDESR